MMRRILLVLLLGVTAAGLFTGVAFGKPKPPTFKTGTYKAKTATAAFNIALKRTKCSGKLQFCVSLPTSPEILCSGPVVEEFPVGSFVALAAVPSSGKLTQHAPVTTPPPIAGAAPGGGQSAFSVTFTKKGTASGYLEESVTQTVQGQTIPCSGKVPFTAKLG